METKEQGKHTTDITIQLSQHDKEGLENYLQARYERCRDSVRLLLGNSSEGLDMLRTMWEGQYWRDKYITLRGKSILHAESINRVTTSSYSDAAPELLAACKEILGMVGQPLSDPWAALHVIKNLTQAAIAKAEGR